MARSLNIVIGADIEKLRQGFNDAIAVIKKSGAEMTADVAKSAKSIEEKLASIATKNPTLATVKQLTQLAMETRALGPEFAHMADQLIREAGKIKDSIGDARAEVGYFASDTRRLDSVIGGVQAVAGAYQLVEGATALMGLESENLQKTMVKLQAAMSIVSGLQELQNLLQQESALVQGILALRTTALAAAQTAYAAAVGTATGVQRAFNLVMAAAPWALAATALASIAYALSAYADKTKKAAQEQKLFNELNAETQKNFEEEVKSVSGLLAVVNNHNASMRERKNALAEIQKIYPDFLANQSLDKVNSAELKTATSNLTAEIFKQAKAKAAFAKLQELSAKMLDYEIGKQQAQLSTQAEINRLYASGASAAQVQGFIDSQKNIGTIAAANAAKIQTQIDAIVQMATAQGLSVTPTTQSTNAIKEQTVAVEQLNQAKAFNNSGISPASQFGASAPTIETFAKATGPLPQYTAVVKRETSEQLRVVTEYQQRMAETMVGVNQAFNSLTAEGLESFGEMLGGIMTGQITTFDDFGKSLLMSVAKFMRAFGSALVATATASKAFKDFILKNPVAAAAAGVALIAGSTIIVGMLNKGPQPTAFAEGGIVSGPTLGLVGEYPNARNNPEVIAPLDKLKGMLKGTGDSAGYVASTTISGRDLALVIERYNKDSRRG
jgi:hypothetical protein